MAYIATFDIGTTAVKGVLMSEDGNCVMEQSVTLDTIFQDEWKEQRPTDWYSSFCQISNHFIKEGLRPEEVLGIAMSGQMQDLIPVGEDHLPVRNAILYSDGRAGAQAKQIADRIGMGDIEKSTGNHFDGSMPFAKFLWMKEQEPSLYATTKKVLISSKDYIVARLTGNFVTDVTSAATSGLMDIQKKSWNVQWMELVGLDPKKLPTLCYAEEPVGVVSEISAVESGFLAGTPVYAGTGDAGATTLASGITADGEFNINLGTSGWIACVSSDVMEKQTVFNLAAMEKNSYINVVPFLNAGNVHKWISGILAPDSDGASKYEYVNLLLSQSKAGSNGVMFLPYLTGERFPVMDTAIKGSYVGIVPETSKEDLARSALEGVAFSIRQGLESLEKKPKKISLIGGGAKVKAWCQILADVLGHPIYVYHGAEYLPAAAIAGAVLLGQGKVSDYASYVNSLLDRTESVCFLPDAQNSKLYGELFVDYLKVYPGVRSIY
ncbi:MAG: sugar kinase [Clostridia bacterium]|nr:sugar kinase [Clostridia bacterium]